MWGVDFEAAWSSARALQADDSPIQVGERVRHCDDGRTYLLRQIVNLIATCTLEPGEGDPEFSRDFPFDELVRPQHINLASLLHSNNTVLDGDSLRTDQIGDKIIEILRNLK